MRKRLFSSAVILSILSLALFYHYGISKATTKDARGLNGEDFARVTPSDPEKAARIERYGRALSSWMDSNLNPSIVPSAVAGVVTPEGLVYFHGSNADVSSRYDVASLTKTFTAVLALRLAEEGVFSLDDPVRKHLPGVVIERAELKSAPVTIRHLLAHTSGIPSSESDCSISNAGGGSFSVPKQAYPAGYCYAYSNAGYVIMKHVIESAAGKSYSDLVRSRIFEPLGMKSSTAAGSNGTGGIVTNISDLSKYVVMLINEGAYGSRRIISADSFNAMMEKTVELPRTSIDYHYSLSWEVITVNGKIDSYYKAGRWFGGASGLQVFPDRKIALVYLCNPPHHLTSDFMNFRQGLTGVLRTLVRNISGDQSLCTKWPAMSPPELGRYQGVYRNTISGNSVRIFLRDGRLFSTINGSASPLSVFTSNRFLVDSGKNLHNFVWKNSRVIGLAVRGGYYELSF